MPDVFGSQGGGLPAPKKPDPKKKPASRGEPDMLYGSMNPAASEAKAGRYVTYDNDTGEILLNIPPRFAKYKHELEEELMEEFMGEPSASADGQRSLDAWVRSWIDKKSKEDPSLAVPDDQDG
jgi:hypothetical protein